MPVQLACPNRTKFAVLYPEEGVVEIKCDRPRCGAGKDRIVLHRWNTKTGEQMETLRFSNPTTTKGT